MKFTSTFLLALTLVPRSLAFAPQTTGRPVTAALSEHKGSDGWFGPAAAGLAGWTLAAQFAFGSPLVAVEHPSAHVQSSDMTSMLISAKLETMDFSMPSYSETLKGDTTSSKPDIPSFNPFGSFESQTAAETADTSDAETKKADEKAAAEAKKEAEKAAIEAKKADKEARRLAELQKQKEAVERANQKKAEEAAASVDAVKEDASSPEFSIPSFSAPEMPEIRIPDMPKMSFSMPKIDLPKIDLPESSELPKVEAPKLPEFTVPKIPEFSAPKIPEFSVPKIPEFNAPKIPEFSAPKILEFNAPKMLEFNAPKVSLPSFDAPKSSGGYDFDVPSSSSFSSPEDDVEPQEVRDSRAKEASSVFNQADNEAKELERQAKALRNIANEKKKIAKELKDEACKTRFGGKFICLRPLNSGY